MASSIDAVGLIVYSLTASFLETQQRYVAWDLQMPKHLSTS